MNPNNAVHRQRLFKAVEHSYRSLEWARNLNRGLIEEYAGSGYGRNNGHLRTTHVNLMNQAVDAYTMTLVANRPRITLTSAHPELEDFRRQFELAINNLIAELQLEYTFRQWVLDAFFCLGIVKVHMADAGALVFENNRLIDPGTPWASNISLDNYGYDICSTKRHETRFEFDMYRMSVEQLRDTNVFNTKGMEIKPTTKYGGDDDRLKRISMGDVVDADELEPMADVCDVWIPDTNRIHTYIVHDPLRMVLDGKSIGEIPWDGPELGPYHHLGFNDVPENIMPTSPASHLAQLNRDINSAKRKQARRARHSKINHAYGAAGADDAKNIRDAADGEWVKVNDPSQIATVPTGGISPELQAYMLGDISLFDRMAGNLTALMGLGAQADTKGQEELIHGAVSKKIAAMMYRVVDACTRVIRDLGYMLWNDEFKVLRGQIPIDGAPGYFVDATWTPEDREGDFFDYNFNIDMESMPYRSSGQRAARISEFISGPLAAAVNMSMMIQGAIDLDQFVDIYADLLHEPRLRQIARFSQTPSMPPGPTDSLKKSPNSTREYIRRSVPTGGTPQSRSMVEQSAWMGQSLNGDQEASLGLPVA